jgi:MFS superfamily sulfate permease-like transporter
MLNSKYKPLIIGIVTLGTLDLIGLATMIVNPNWTERVIPALVGIQIVGFVAVAIVYMICAQRQFGAAGSLGVPVDPSAGSANVERPKWKRMRWLWFAFAALGILQTPTALSNAIHVANSEHRLAPVMVLAFVIRFGMIGLFLKLWWQFRPANQ